MTPTCLTCGREVEEGRTRCHTCLAEVNRIVKICKKCNRPAAKGADLCHVCIEKLFERDYDPSQPEPKIHCVDCGDEIVSGTLCDFCLAKAAQPQSYPPSIVPAAVDEMKSAIMDSMMLTLTNIVEQADALIVQLARLKGAIK